MAAMLLARAPPLTLPSPRKRGEGEEWLVYG